ncbi:MAG TPA: hypothetical protein VJ276_18235 [Thermoanaerobaculia bacterium]|nr:hypothetical protein [Thermoanaerobaculia bacterium]
MTLPLRIYQPPAGRPPGQFLYVTHAAADRVRFSIRVRDVAHEDTNWGTEIPVVRDDQYFGQTFSLLGIPTDARFRQSLRIYESALEGKGRVEVKVFPMSDGPPLGTAVLDLPSQEPFIYNPGNAEILSLSDAFPAIRGAGNVRVEITPLTDGGAVWAFVSITNNETQQVSLVTPQ